jgi:integrase
MEHLDDEVDEQSYLNEILIECEEAAEFEISQAHAVVGDSIPKQRRSGLVEKLKADPNGEFNISEFSTYREDRWILHREAHRSEERVLFNSQVCGSNDLKRMLVYHLLPQFHPLGNIRSFVSTRTYASAYPKIERYLLEPNGLDATPDSIKIISSRLINDALDRARDDGAARAYFLLYFITAFWLMLSENGLIPTTHCLDVPLRLVDTAERREDVQKAITKEYKGWKPYSEDELAILLDFSLFWIEDGIPKMVAIKNFLRDNAAEKIKHRYFITNKPWPQFEEMLGQERNGKEICGFTRVDRNETVRLNGKTYEYTRFHYRWVIKYKVALDKIRDAILVIFALVIGMRKRELGILSFDDIILRPNGDWVVNATRFKTSTDPAYFGTNEEIPLPGFIGEAIQVYKELRSFGGNMRGGVLFEQVSNSRKTNLVDRSITRAFMNLGDDIGVHGVHPHRSRKTIAEILINRSERNIDLIRLLFGHKSYAMSLRYIARNPYLVHSVVEALEVNYTEAFLEIVAGIRTGSFSGEAASRIAKATRPDNPIFKGKLLRLTVFNYISHLLQTGEPVYVKRVNLGVYCVSGSDEFLTKQMPCQASMKNFSDNRLPNVENCTLDCKSLIVLNDARASLESNVVFYSSLIENHGDKLSLKSKKLFFNKIAACKKHLDRLSNSQDYLVSQG